MKKDDWITADEACRTLGVRAQTLYAYASRGLLRAQAHPDDARRSLYRRVEVDELAMRKGRSRKLADIASAAIAWGEPVLQSAITTVREGRCYYRGIDAAELSDSATLESVAGILIGSASAVAPVAERLPFIEGPLPIHRLFQTLASRAARAEPSAGASMSSLANEATLLLNLVADAVAGTQSPGAIHQRLAQVWGADPDGPVADLIRHMLVLLADHELNASTFAARVTASTGAPLAAALLSGLAALSGPRHGGMGAMVQRLVEEAAEHGSLATVKMRLADGAPLPGFGHPLYPHGDIRAKVVLAKIPVPPILAEIRTAARDLAGLEPNIDFAVTAACAVHGLPAGAPLALFATARSAGWLAHAIEQSASGQLIRPRARYVGPIAQHQNQEQS